jgi:hypothetical protein
MAKVLVFNTREHSIHLNIPGTATDSKGKPYVPQEPVVVPPAKMGERDGQPEKINGQLLIESEHLEAAKKHPVVQHYFKEGWLRAKPEEKSGKSSDSKPADQ